MLVGDLHRFACSITKSKEVSEEIVSDVFIKLWRIRTRLQEIENLKVYLYTMTKNYALNHIKQNNKQIVANNDLTDLPVDTIIFTETPESLCMSADSMKQIQKCIAQLPSQCRIIFQLVKEDGLKYKEVAEILNISVLTVRNQVAIAVKKLANTLSSSRPRINEKHTLGLDRP